MKKIYNAPVIEYTSVVRCGFLCTSTSGTDNSGSGMMDTGGGGTGSGSGSGGMTAPKRRVF